MRKLEVPIIRIVAPRRNLSFARLRARISSMAQGSDVCDRDKTGVWKRKGVDGWRICGWV